MCHLFWFIFLSFSLWAFELLFIWYACVSHSSVELWRLTARAQRCVAALVCSFVRCPLEAWLPFLAWSTSWGSAHAKWTGKRGKDPSRGQKNASTGPVCQTVGTSIIVPGAVWEGGGSLMAKKPFQLVCTAPPPGQKGLSQRDRSSDVEV